jgi:glycerate dehydrogenase
MKIVFLDSYSVGGVDLSSFDALGEFVEYAQTAKNQVIERCKDADVVIINKVELLKPELELLPQLKLICIAATGMNNVDLNFAAEKGITVKNVANYSTESVAQTTFALTLGIIHHVGFYDQYVKGGDYTRSGLFTHHGRPFMELKEKNWGIIGLGNIGKRVAQIADVFGAKVSYYSTSGQNNAADYTQKSLDQLLQDSDIISIHSPLNDQTLNLLDYKKLCLMKPSAFLVNVGRGGIVNEADLALALSENRLAGAGFDVFEQEPIAFNHPFLAADIQDKILLAPHVAWASVESRQRLVGKIYENIKTHFVIT